MRELERYFVLDEFEDGWGLDEFYHEELLYDYCTEALFIPDEKIEELNMNSLGLEIHLCDLDQDDANEDWYVNLLKSSKETTNNNRYIA